MTTDRSDKPAMAQGVSLGIKIYLSYAIAYVIPIVLLLATYGVYQNVQQFRFFFPEYRQDIDLLDAINLHQQYQKWQNALVNFTNMPSDELFEAFSEQDNQWENLLYALERKATSPQWNAFLEKSKASRDQVMVSVNQLIEPTVLLRDGVDKTLLPQGYMVIDALQKLQSAFAVAKEFDQALLVAGALQDFQSAHLDSIRFATTGDSQALRETRASFIRIEDKLTQADVSNNDRAAQLKTDARTILGTFYNNFEAIAATRNDQDAAREEIQQGQLLKSIQDVNPLAGSSWKVADGDAQSRRLGQAFQQMEYLLLGGLVILVIGALYSLTHAYTSYQRPLRELVSFAAHAYITRKRTPVPGIERKDELGVLARALQGMLERLHMARLNETVSDMPEAVLSVATESSPAALDTGLKQNTTPAVVFNQQALALMQQEQLEIVQRAIQHFEQYNNALAQQTRQSGVMAEDVRQALQNAASKLQAMVNSASTFREEWRIITRISRDARDTASKVETRLHNIRLAIAKNREVLPALAAQAQGLEAIARRLQVAQSKGLTEQAAGEAIEALLVLAQQYPEVEAFLYRENALLEESSRHSSDQLAAHSRQLSMQYKQLAGLAAKYDVEVKDLPDHHSKVQHATFEAGRLALLLLEISGQIVESCRTAREAHQVLESLPIRDE